MTFENAGALPVAALEYFPESESSKTFAQQVVRRIAWMGLIFGSIAAVVLVIELSVRFGWFGGSGAGFFSGPGAMFERLLSLVYATALVVLLISASMCLKRQASGRVGMLTYAYLGIAHASVALISTAIREISRIPLASGLARHELLYIFSSTFFYMMTFGVFPMVVLLLFRTTAVRDVFKP